MQQAEVASRRQKLNETAYFTVLNAFVVGNQSQIPLSARLRRELNISNEQHKAWVEELRKGGAGAAGGQSRAAAAQPAVAAGAAGSRPARAVSRQNSQQPQQSRPKKRKAELEGAAQQEQSGDAEMVGYRVQYLYEPTGTWQEGVITRYQDGNICITFNMGTESEIHHWVKWEASERLKMMMAPRLDLGGYRPVRSQYA